MTEVIIRRCTLRVVRRRGWSWGADPRGLVRAAVAALPALLAGKLSELLPDGEDVELSAPVSLRVPLRLSELLALAGDPGAVSASAAPHDSPAARAVAARLAQAIEAALPTKHAAEEARAEAQRAAAAEAFEGAAEEETEAADAAPLLRLLLAWRAAGELETHLSTLGEAALALWQRALAETTFEASALSTHDVGRLAREVAAKLHPRASGRASMLRLRIAAAVECVERWRIAPGDAALREALAETLPTAEARRSEGAQTSAAEAPRAAEDAAAPAARASGVAGEAATGAATSREAARVVRAAEVTVSSALPFLLLGPLARVGYWGALAGALEAGRLEDESALFAAALAYKVSGPPARGWRRAPEEERAAAAFAGLDEAPQGSALAEFARRVAPHLPPLDSVVAHALVQGHAPGRPVLLHRAAGDEARGAELVLFDTEGLFAVACADDWPALLPAARHFAETHVLVPASAATPRLLAALDAAGFTFVTDAPPARGEAWRELRRAPDVRCYTNDAGARVAPLFASAALLGRAAEEAELLWRALARERAGVATERGARLERSLTQAAALALGTLAWELWREREPTTPLLALERFGDIEARVRFTETRVHVTLPLGRRRADLARAGLLADVRGVPWLGRRVVQFAGG